MKTRSSFANNVVRWKALVSLLILFLVLSSCTAVPGLVTGDSEGSNPLPVPTPAEIAVEMSPTPEHIKISIMPLLAFTPFMIAQDEDIFGQYGLAAELVPVASTNEAIPLLMQGQLDVAQIALSPGLFNAIARGGSARIVMGATRWSTSGCSAIGLAVRNTDLDRFRNPSQWAGATIATDPVGGTGMQGMLMDRLLSQVGLTGSDVVIETLPLPTMVEALQSGAIDMVLLSEPWLTRVLTAVDADVLWEGRDVLPDGQVAVIAFSERLLRDRLLGARVVQAYQEGLRRYQAGKVEHNVAIVAQYTQLDPELIAQSCWADLPTDGSLNIESIMEYQNWAIEQNLLDTVLLPDAFWDDQLVNEAKQANE